MPEKPPLFAPASLRLARTVIAGERRSAGPLKCRDACFSVAPVKCPDPPFGVRARVAGLVALSLSLACSGTPAPANITLAVAPADAPAPSSAPALSSAPSPGDAPASPAPPAASAPNPPTTGPCAGEVVSTARSAVGDMGVSLVESESLHAQVLCIRKGQTHTVLLQLNSADLQQQSTIMKEITPILAGFPGKVLTPNQLKTLEKSLWEVSDLWFSAKGDRVYFTSTLMGVGAPPQLTWQVDLQTEKRSLLAWGSVRPVAAGVHAGKLLRVWHTYDSPKSPTYRPGVITKCEIVNEQGKTQKALSDADCDKALSDAPP
ncbi:hypothetical protein A7982_13935 [Minicystis rosea]|nr:hypothetical protein A7982_13935 [Minicystis rosea]